jgi:hypothetical protein
MTETEWLNSTDPSAMLAFLEAGGTTSDRRYRLFACACCRRIWDLLTDEESRKAVEVAEGYAEGLADDARLESAWKAAAYAADHADESDAPSSACNATDSDPWGAARHASFCAAQAAAVDTTGERSLQCDLLRDIIGNPLRPLPSLDGAPDWNDGLIVRLAEAAHDNRHLPSGHLEPARLAVLADALEEAGADPELTDHLRGAGPHVRGCFVVDLLLGKG